MRKNQAFTHSTELGGIRAYTKHYFKGTPMTNLEKMSLYAQAFADEVEAAIKVRDFTLIKEGVRIYDILVCDTKLSIWMSNEPKDTEIYQLLHGDFDLVERYPSHKFKNPHRIRNILMADKLNSMEEPLEEHY